MVCSLGFSDDGCWWLAAGRGAQSNRVTQTLIDTNQSEEALCIHSLTVFLAKPSTFVSLCTFRSCTPSVCLTKHMFVLTMQKAEPDRTRGSFPPHNTCMHATSIYFCYHTHFTIHCLNSADHNARLQCFINAFLIYFSSPRSQVSAQGHFTPHPISFVPLFPFPLTSTNPSPRVKYSCLGFRPWVFFFLFLGVLFLFRVFIFHRLFFRALKKREKWKCAFYAVLSLSRLASSSRPETSAIFLILVAAILR